jgi:regulator of sirC expression with transglutaminase-like and TPR domain
MDATARFIELVSGSEAEMRLDEACLLVAAHAHPGLVVADQLAKLDDLAGRVAEPDVDAVVDLLFKREGFKGNVDDYYDPENSHLDSVLERRVGIPLTLSVLAMEVGRRVGVPLEGVGMPGHFLVRTRSDPPAFFDPFGGGRQLDVDGCADLLRQAQGNQVPFSIDLLDAVGPRAIVARLLANLRATYEQRGDRRALLWVLRLRSRIPGVPLVELRALASALASAGRFDEAAAELERLAGQIDEVPAGKLRSRARQLRALLN